MSILNKIHTSMFPKVYYYRQLGVEFRLFAADKLKNLATLLGEDEEYMTSQMALYANRANFDVPAQAFLINMEICGLNAESYQPYSQQAAFAIGTLWAGIKLIDSYLDKNQISGAEREDFLGQLMESCIDGKPYSDRNPDKDRIINSARKVAAEGVVGEIYLYRSELEDLARANSSHSRKLDISKEVGFRAARLTTALAQQYVPAYPNGCQPFLDEQGITANLFDDLKDLKNDHEEGHGYKACEVPGLLFSWGYHLFQHHSLLPKTEYRLRNIRFISLAALFHIQELLGNKEKS